MKFFSTTPSDRYAAAHEHFGSAGFTFGKVAVLLVIAGFIGFLIYYAVKKR